MHGIKKIRIPKLVITVKKQKQFHNSKRALWILKFSFT